MAVREADAKQEYKQMAVTSWHEAQSLKKSNPKMREAETSMMTADLKELSNTLVRVRRERLRELYTAEMATLQAELASRGLTIETKRD